MDVLAALLIIFLVDRFTSWDVGMEVTYDRENELCYKSGWIGSVDFSKKITNYKGVDVKYVYRHESCLTEEDDKGTQDSVGVRLEF